MLADHEAKKMVEIADYKRNGVIDFDEFVELMSSESKVRHLLPLSPFTRFRPFQQAHTCGDA